MTPTIFSEVHNGYCLKETGEMFFKIYQRNCILQEGDILQFNEFENKTTEIHPDSELIGEDLRQTEVVFRQFGKDISIV